MTTYYNIYNIISIKVNDYSGTNIANSLDFNIKYFKTEKPVISKYQLNIFPFASFKKSDGLSIFHLVKGCDGEYLLDENNRLAIKKEGAGFDIYTDHSFPILLFLQLLLSNENISLIHSAAAVNKNGKAILFPGPGGVGKTSLLSSLIQDMGYKLLGDDIVALDSEGACYPFPRSFILKKYHKEEYSKIFKKLKLNNPYKKFKPFVVEFFYKNLPFMGITKWILQKFELKNKMIKLFSLPKDYEAAVPVAEIFGEGIIGDKSEVAKFIFIERYEGIKFEIMPIEYNEMSSRVFSIINHEMSSYMKLLFSLGAINITNTANFFENCNINIKKSIINKEILICKIPLSAKPKELIKFLSKYLS